MSNRPSGRRTIEEPDRASKADSGAAQGAPIIIHAEGTINASVARMNNPVLVLNPVLVFIESPLVVFFGTKQIATVSTFFEGCEYTWVFASYKGTKVLIFL